MLKKFGLWKGLAVVIIRIDCLLVPWFDEIVMESCCQAASARWMQGRIEDVCPSNHGRKCAKNKPKEGRLVDVITCNI